RQHIGAEHAGLPGAADVGQTGRFDHAVRDVDPEAVDAQVQPEPQDVEELLAYLRVLPVEVGLFGREQVEVPLPVGEPGPGGAAEDRLPVVGRQFAVRAPAPAEDVAFTLGAARPGGDRVAEPRVPVGGVVGHDVHDHPQAVRV